MGTNNKKILFISMIFSLIVLFLIFFAVFPFLKGIKKDSENFVSMKKDLILFKDKSDNFEKIRETYSSHKTNLEKLDELFIDSNMPIDLIKFWEKTAEDSGTSIEISPLSLRKGEADSWNSIGFQIISTGTSVNFLKFLEKIETSPYLTEIENFNIKRGYQMKEGQGKEFGDNISATLIVRVYAK